MLPNATNAGAPGLMQSSTTQSSFSNLKNLCKGNLNAANNLKCCRNAANNSWLWLEEIYQDESLMRKLHNQLIFLNVKTPTLMACLYYSQE